jgi:hypothetical protein
VHAHSVLRTDGPTGNATLSDSLFDTEGHAHRAYDAKDGTLVWSDWTAMSASSRMTTHRVAFKLIWNTWLPRDSTSEN